MAPLCPIFCFSSISSFPLPPPPLLLSPSLYSPEESLHIAQPLPPPCLHHTFVLLPHRLREWTGGTMPGTSTSGRPSWRRPLGSGWRMMTIAEEASRCELFELNMW
eukprot:717142-Hanusia_phi.AAC.2